MNSASAIDCKTAGRLIDRHVLDELDEADRRLLAVHLRRCAACTAELRAANRLFELLGTLPTPSPSPDLDQRIVAAAIADRQRRTERVPWLAGLRTEILRGVMRTTGTLVLTIVAVALLGGAVVFAASAFFVSRVETAHNGPSITPPIHTPAPTAASSTTTPATVAATMPSSAPPSTATPQPTPAPSPTPEPTATPTPTPSPSATPAPSPSESAEPTPTATQTASPTPSPTPTPTPSPSPTDKRRTAPPSPSSTPSPNAAPAASLSP